MSIEKILVPSDLDDASLPAVEAAVDLARLTGASILFVHVIDMVYYDYGWMYEGIPIPRDMMVSREQDIIGQLDQLLTPAQKQGLNIETLVVYGQPHQAILDVSKDKGAELIVMGTHGRRGLSHLFLGSVAEKVVRLASVPVLTVRSTAKETSEDEERLKVSVAN